MLKGLQRISLGVLALLFYSGQVWGWSSDMHLFIAEAAGLQYPLTACFPDLSKKDNEKLLGRITGMPLRRAPWSTPRISIDSR